MSWVPLILFIFLVFSVITGKEVLSAYCSYLKLVIVYHSYCTFDFMYNLVIFVFIERLEFYLHTEVQAVTNSGS